MKELTEQECLDLLADNYIGRMAYISNERSEIIPITYYFDPEQRAVISYSDEGTKIEAMRQNSSVSFQVDEINTLDKWRSVLLYGTYEELSGMDAKYLLHKFSEGVKKIILRKDKTNLHFISEFSSKADTNGTPIVYRLRITEIHGKQRE